MTRPAVAVRPAVEADIPALLDIWNPQIRHSTITFSSEEKTAEGLAAMIASRRAGGYEFLVAEEDGRLMGLATYAQFRAGNGYAYSMEHTVILSPDAWGRGVGRALMTAVEGHARDRGYHVMVAAVTGENARGLGFHKALGYTEVGRMPQQGRKFGRWLDLVLMQKLL